MLFRSMTNLQQARGPREGILSPATLKRLWFWSPIVAVGVLSAVCLLGLALPQALEINRSLERVNELEGYRQELESLQLQARQIAKDRLETQRQREQLVRLVAGQRDLATFLATLDLEAKASRVTLQLYEPVAALPAPGTPGAAPSSAAPGSPPPAAPAPATPPAAGQAPAPAAARGAASSEIGRAHV